MVLSMYFSLNCWSKRVLTLLNLHPSLETDYSSHTSSIQFRLHVSSLPFSELNFHSKYLKTLLAFVYDPSVHHFTNQFPWTSTCSKVTWGDASNLSQIYVKLARRLGCSITLQLLENSATRLAHFQKFDNMALMHPTSNCNRFTGHFFLC